MLVLALLPRLCRSVLLDDVKTTPTPRQSCFQTSTVSRSNADQLQILVVLTWVLGMLPLPSGLQGSLIERLLPRKLPEISMRLQVMPLGSQGDPATQSSHFRSYAAVI